MNPQAKGVCVYMCVRHRPSDIRWHACISASLDCPSIHICTYNVFLTSSSNRACLFFLLAFSCLCSSCNTSSLRCSLPCCSNSSSSSSSSCSRVWGEDRSVRHKACCKKEVMLWSLWPGSWILNDVIPQWKKYFQYLFQHQITVINKGFMQM